MRIQEYIKGRISADIDANTDEIDPMLRLVLWQNISYVIQGIMQKQNDTDYAIEQICETEKSLSNIYDRTITLEETKKAAAVVSSMCGYAEKSKIDGVSQYLENIVGNVNTQVYHVLSRDLPN